MYNALRWVFQIYFAREIVNAQSKVVMPAQPQQRRGGAIEPDDLALRIQDNDPIGQRGCGTLNLADELNVALLVEALAAMQAHDLRHDLAPGAAKNWR